MLSELQLILANDKLSICVSGSILETEVWQFSRIRKKKKGQVAGSQCLVERLTQRSPSPILANWWGTAHGCPS